jgi:N-formylglutamate amidohydrolase
MQTILHIPHASLAIPPEALSDYVVSRDILDEHLVRSTDHFTDELFRATDADTCTVTHEISRLAVDPERFEDDAREPMAAKGLGVLYERGHDGTRIRRPLDPARRQWYLDRWYRPHHQRLTDATDAALARAGRVLIIDAHSYPDEPLAVDTDKAQPRPDACIGTAGIHTPAGLVDAAVAYCRSAGWSLGVDAPYSGSIVPMKHFGLDARVMSVMIEINRKRYMRLDRTRAVRSDGFEPTKAFVAGLVAALRDAAGKEDR